MTKRMSGSMRGWAVVAGLVLIVMIPLEVWIALGALAALAGVIYLFVRIVSNSASANTPKAHPESSEPLVAEPTLSEILAQEQREKRAPRPAVRAVSHPTQARTPAPAPAERVALAPTSQRTETTAASPTSNFGSEAKQRTLSPNPPKEGFFATLLGSSAGQAGGRAIPKAPAGYGGPTRWVESGQAVEVAGVPLPGGTIYVGAKLESVNGRREPSLINPALPVARQGDFTQQQMDYWPCYSDITPSARRAYLNWLQSGRTHPACNIGFVFLFFYGLERRAILDANEDPSARNDLPAIEAEVHRLLAIYGQSSGSFRRYASGLLDWIALSRTDGKLYEAPLPALPETSELPFYLKLALGQSAVDRAPVPAALALAWARADPGISVFTAGKRCPEEFDRLFLQLYHQELGSGLVLPKNRTKLKAVYRPASAGLMGLGLTRSFGDIPDVTALTAPSRQLQKIVDQCVADLAGFSRAVGKDPAARDRLDGLLHLPGSLWPKSARAKLQGVLDWMEDGRLTLPLGELLTALGGAGEALNRDRAKGLAKALAALNVGMEPDVLSGARLPAVDDPIVLFSAAPGDGQRHDTGAYQAATLTLQLASAVAIADGEFTEEEVEHLRAEVRGWSHLTPAHQTRLQAHIQWLAAAPVTLASLKKRLAPLEQRAKETIATFMATLAQADGFVSPKEVKFLEKVYRALGVDSKRVFSDVHAVASATPGTSHRPATGFQLDTARIEELRRDTKKVTALLAEIFNEDDDPGVEAPLAPEDPPESEALLGLDEAHAALVRLLMSRPQWTRSELEDAAADLELMLDGALEKVNEASFDAYDMALAEGDDPVDVNEQAAEKLEA